MKVILTTDVPKIGKKDDVLELKDGFAQNVLLSRGKAILATSGALGELNARKAKQEKKRQEDNVAFGELVDNINNKKIIIKSKANDKGVLFKSVSENDIRDAIKKMIGVDIDTHTINIKDHIKTLGSHTIEIKRGDMKGKCEIIVENI